MAGLPAGERLLDLSRLAQQAASALDSASDPLPRFFADADNDLEVAYFTNEREDHQEVGHRLVAPLLLDDRRLSHHPS